MFGFILDLGVSGLSVFYLCFSLFICVVGRELFFYRVVIKRGWEYGEEY